MPIRVTCRCGQNLSVPDAMAGKSGKCPKCSEIIKIPAASTTSTKAGASKVASPSTKTVKPISKSTSATQPEPKPKAATAGGALDQLFADAGLDKKKGPECPSCKSPIDVNAMLCVKCGFNLSTGQKMKGFEVDGPKDAGPFANRQLNEAQRSLKKETDADEAAKFTGAPWWVSLAVVLGLITVIAFGVIIVEGQGAEETEDGVSLRAPVTTIRGKIQRLPIPNALLVVSSLVSSMVVIMAWIATWATAFRDKIGQGFLCIFIPVYAHYYSFANRKTMGATMRILWGWTVVWIALAVGMATTGTLKFMMK